jgi:hypothetical protein
MQVVNILIIRCSSGFNPSYSHVIPQPITHITSHFTLSLGDEIDSRSDLASTTKAEIQHETRGKGIKGLLSLIKWSVGHGNVYIRERGYTYRSINSAERVHLVIHKIAILDDPAHLGWFRLPPNRYSTTQPLSLGPPRSPPKRWDCET